MKPTDMTVTVELDNKAGKVVRRIAGALAKVSNAFLQHLDQTARGAQLCRNTEVEQIRDSMLKIAEEGDAPKGGDAPERKCGTCLHRERERCNVITGIAVEPHFGTRCERWQPRPPQSALEEESPTTPTDCLQDNGEPCRPDECHYGDPEDDCTWVPPVPDETDLVSPPEAPKKGGGAQPVTVWLRFIGGQWEWTASTVTEFATGAMGSFQSAAARAREKLIEWGRMPVEPGLPRDDVQPAGESLADEMERHADINTDLDCEGMAELMRDWASRVRALTQELAAQTDAAQYNCMRAHDLEVERDEAIKRAAKYREQRDVLRAKSGRQRRELRRLNRIIVPLHGASNKLAHDWVEADEKRRKQEQRAEAAENERDDLRNRVRELGSMVPVLNDESAALSATVTGLEKERDELRERLTAIEAAEPAPAQVVVPRELVDELNAWVKSTYRDWWLDPPKAIRALLALLKGTDAKVVTRAQWEADIQPYLEGYGMSIQTIRCIGGRLGIPEDWVGSESDG